LNRVRAVFEKKDRAKYISHLDLNRCMLRIFRRSGLPIWYTEGYNPHPYYAFALALSLGFESSCEILDFNITDDEMSMEEIRDRLNEVMPEGMKIISVKPQRKKITEIAKAEYVVSLETADPEKLLADVKALMASDEILIEKKTKRGFKTVNIKPDTEIVKCTVNDSALEIVMRLPAGTQMNYNPSLFLDSLKNAGAQPFSVKKICRTGILRADNKAFE